MMQYCINKRLENAISFIDVNYMKCSAAGELKWGDSCGRWNLRLNEQTNIVLLWDIFSYPQK